MMNIPQKNKNQQGLTERQREQAIDDFVSGKESKRRTGEGYSWYNVPIPKEIHKQAKRSAEDLDMTLAQYIICALDEMNKKQQK